MLLPVVHISYSDLTIINYMLVLKASRVPLLFFQVNIYSNVVPQPSELPHSNWDVDPSA